MREVLVHPPPESITGLARTALLLHRRHVVSTFATHRRIVELRDLAELVDDPLARTAVVRWLIEVAGLLWNQLDRETGPALATQLKTYLEQAAGLLPDGSDAAGQLDHLESLISRWPMLTPSHRWMIAQRIYAIELSLYVA